jgi:methionine-rich copper-binding protein CopC
MIARLVCLVAVWLAFVATARAHAFLDHADPRVGSTVTAPASVKIWMTEELEPAFCKLQVFDAAGTEVDKREAKVSGATMSVALPPLPPGTYQVSWKAVATDTHKTTGTFSFTVK